MEMVNVELGPPPSVSIGLPVYNGAEHLRTAFDNVLAQNFKDFELIVSDNASTDKTPEYCLEYAKKDSRIRLYRNTKNLGMIKNFRKVVELARGEYFIWVSDHDIYYPNYLQALMEALKKNPGSVLAYSYTDRISGDGELIRVDNGVLETVGMDARTRIKTVCIKAKGFGNRVYGLFRIDALRKAGVYRDHIYPDVLLLLELSMQGSFSQVRESLWARRYIGLFSVKRQKKALFPNGSWRMHIPWPITHFFSLLWNTTFKPGSGSLRYRFNGVYLAFMSIRRVFRVTSKNLHRRWIDTRIRVAKIGWIRGLYHFIIRKEK